MMWVSSCCASELRHVLDADVCFPGICRVESTPPWLWHYNILRLDQSYRSPSALHVVVVSFFRWTKDFQQKDGIRIPHHSITRKVSTCDFWGPFNTKSIMWLVIARFQCARLILSLKNMVAITMMTNDATFQHEWRVSLRWLWYLNNPPRDTQEKKAFHLLGDTSTSRYLPKREGCEQGEDLVVYYKMLYQYRPC